MTLSKSMTLVVQSMPQFLHGAMVTAGIAIAVFLIGMLGGLALGLANCNKLKLRGLGGLIDLYVLIVRGTPSYVQILLAYFVLPEIIGFNLSPIVAGTIALGCNAIAYITEIVRCGINSIPAGQWEAAYVLGYSTRKTVTAIIVPLMLRNVLPALTNEVAVLLKETSMLSMIGVMEITKIGMNISAKTLDPIGAYGAVAMLYLIMTSLISFCANKLEKVLNHDKN